ncbi:hypothetical protein T492DRAFT_850393 [Pavlovales sp. CCMP2436]|nr:hypothetical protein T492DRAFT_850393 [Pavlovales sp. CCMP2436]
MWGGVDVWIVGGLGGSACGVRRDVVDVRMCGSWKALEDRHVVYGRTSSMYGCADFSSLCKHTHRGVFYKPNSYYSIGARTARRVRPSHAHFSAPEVDRGSPSAWTSSQFEGLAQTLLAWSPHPRPAGHADREAARTTISLPATTSVDQTAGLAVKTTGQA